MPRQDSKICGLLLMCLCLGLAGCPTTPKITDKDIERITTEQLTKMLDDTRQSTILLDVRPAVRFTKVHLPDTLNIPLPDLVANDRRLAEAKNIIVYGDGFYDYLAPAGAKKLIALGYANVYLYDGGIELWQKEGRAVVTAPEPAPPDGVQPK